MKRCLKKSLALFLAFLMALSAMSVMAMADQIQGNETEDEAVPVEEDSMANTILPLAATATGTCGDNLAWTLDSNGTLTVSGTGKMSNYSSASSVPWYSYLDSITSLVLEDGVTSVGNYAFYGCKNLNKLTISDSVSSIGLFAFALCHSLSDVSLGNGLDSIGNLAFFCCFKLKDLTIPDSVTSIGISICDMCTNLSEFKVGEGNSSYCSIDGVLFNKDQTILVEYPLGKDKISYVVPNGVTEIAYSAFNHCSVLESVQFPDGLVTIGDYAFSECTGLKEIKFPDSLIEVGKDSFLSCSNVTKIDFGNGIERIDYEAFSRCDALTSVTLPDSLKELARCPFYSCANLSSVTLGKGLTFVGYHAFAFCYNLDEVIFTGDAPEFEIVDTSGGGPFARDTLTVYYPSGNSTWTSDVMRDYAGSVTWVSYDLAKGTPHVNGFSERNGNWYYYVNGKIDTSKNTVMYGTVNGVEGWYEVINGQVQLDHTGVTNVGNEYGWWYVVNGKVDFSKNSVEQNNNGWWYVLGGQVQFGYTGVANYANDYGWWYISGGQVDFSRNSVEKNNYGWWYVLGGQVQFGYTGVANYANSYGWWYVKNGQVDFSRNSVEQNNYGWWYVLGGQVQFEYTGVANYANDYGWWYINGGQVNFSRNSVEQNAYGWWYVTDGKVDFSYTGVANYANDYGWWHVNSGQVDFSFYGWSSNKNGTWYCAGGKVDFGGSASRGATVCANHSWDAGIVTRASTCKTNGEKLYTCSKCGATRTESTALSGHNYQPVYRTVHHDAVSETGHESLPNNLTSYLIGGDRVDVTMSPNGIWLYGAEDISYIGEAGKFYAKTGSTDYQVCRRCGYAELPTGGGTTETFSAHLFFCGSSYTLLSVPEIEEIQFVYVVDTPYQAAYDSYVIDHYECSVCGARLY